MTEVVRRQAPQNASDGGVRPIGALVVHALHCAIGMGCGSATRQRGPSTELRSKRNCPRAAQSSRGKALPSLRRQSSDAARSQPALAQRCRAWAKQPELTWRPGCARNPYLPRHATCGGKVCSSGKAADQGGRGREGGLPKEGLSRVPLLTNPLSTTLLTTPSVGDLIDDRGPDTPLRAEGGETWMSGVPPTECASWANVRPDPTKQRDVRHVSMALLGRTWTNLGPSCTTCCGVLRTSWSWGPRRPPRGL